MAIIDLTICNRAIDKVAGDRIETMDEESPLGAFCADNYPAKRDFVLSKYRWTFANRVALMARQEPAADELRPLAFKYAAPADLVGAVHAWRETPDPLATRARPYVLDSDGSFWSDQNPLYAEYTARRPEGEWPAWFTELVVTAFAADMALFCQNRTLGDRLESRAWGTPQENGQGGLFGSAMNEDARLAPPRELISGVDPGPLVASRYGFGSPFAGRSWRTEG